MNFIKKIFSGNQDESVHSQFVRFSVGDYYPRAVLSIKNGKIVKIKSGFEYGNDFIKFIIENATGKVKVNGKIYSKKDFTSELIDCKEKKKGFYIGIINREMSIDDLNQLYKQTNKESYLLLSVKGEGFDLKINQSPHNPRGSYKANFCNLHLSNHLADKAIKEFAFDIKNDFKQLLSCHRFLIEDIKVPKEFESDLLNARLMAKRTGKIIRELEFDGTKEKTEAKLNA